MKNRNNFGMRLTSFINSKSTIIYRAIAPIYKQTFCLIFLKILSLFFPTKTSCKSSSEYAVMRSKWYSAKSTQGSTEKIHVNDTLEQFSGKRSHSVCYEDLWWSPISDFQLIKFCHQKKITHLVVSSWSEKLYNHPSKFAFKFLSQKMGIQVYVIWWDTCSSKFSKILYSAYKYIDFHIITDNPIGFLLSEQQLAAPNIKRLWTPQSNNFFYKIDQKKFKVSFQGQVSSYRGYRKEILDHLKEAGVEGYFSSSTRETQNTYEEYSRVTRESMGVINFSYSVNCDQLKSRVFEALHSGALLFESDNQQIRRYFEPYVDYVPYFNKSDLIEKIKYFISNDDERERVAVSGYRKAKDSFSSDAFWKAVFS